MLHKITLPALLCGSLLSAPAWAGDEGSPSAATSNFTLVSDYVFRGISQTNSMPAVQGGMDFTAGNGFYVGVWGSNVSILADKGAATSSSLELDGYAGFKNTFAEDFFYDAGVLLYHYPAAYAPGAVNADTNELHVGLGYSWLAVKYSYSVGNAFGVAQSAGSTYLDVSINYPITDSGFTLGAHYGQQKYQGQTAASLAAANMDPSYKDYKLSVNKELNGFILGVAYSKTASVSSYYASTRVGNLGRSVTVFSLSKTF